MRQNIPKDISNPTMLKQASDTFLAGVEADEYNTPHDASPEWWRDMLVDGKVLVMAGKDELFVDGIVAFGQKLKIFAATPDDWRTKPRVRRATLVLLT
jgi:hypothetical protein